MATRVLTKILKACGMCKNRNVCNHKRFVACAYEFEDHFEVIKHKNIKGEKSVKLKYSKPVFIPKNNLLGVNVNGTQICRSICAVMNEINANTSKSYATIMNEQMSRMNSSLRSNDK